jgi:magnesium-transporting ATPase (P-type)
VVAVENSWHQVEIIAVSKKYFGSGLSSILEAFDDGNAAVTSDAAYHQVTYRRDRVLTPQSIDHDQNQNFLSAFDYRCMRFIFNHRSGLFFDNTAWRESRHADELSTVLDRSGHQDRKMLFGANEIAIPEKPTSRLLLDEVLHPFYVFQIFSILLWSLENYFYYATCIFLVSAVSASSTLIETKKVRDARDVLQTYLAESQTHARNGAILVHGQCVAILFLAPSAVGRLGSWRRLSNIGRIIEFSLRFDSSCWRLHCQRKHAYR